MRIPKKIFFIVLVLAVGVVVLNFFFRKPAPKQFPPGAVATPTPVAVGPIDLKKMDYSTVFPDPATAQKVSSSLQNPIDYQKQGGLTVISFPSDVKDRNNKLYEENNTAVYVSQEVTTDNTALNDFTSSHPNSQSFQLYDANSTGAGFTWHIFPNDGVAFLANGAYGYAIQVIYFPKTTQTQFTQTTAKVFNMLSQNPFNDTSPEPFTQSP